MRKYFHNYKKAVREPPMPTLGDKKGHHVEASLNFTNQEAGTINHFSKKYSIKRRTQ